MHDLAVPADELVAEPSAPEESASEADSASTVQTLALSFTGSGREYFRIWVVNLLLSLASAGIYSAWAKVRRLQYFDRNTELAGARFDFHGKPRSILWGRALAVVLLAAYHYAFGISIAAGVVTIAVLFASLPFLMRGALRFRLGNTSYRGLHFHFSGSVPMAYKVYLAPIAIFLLPGVLAAVYGETPWVAAVWLLYLAWPAMYAWMKHYQYAHVSYGDQDSYNELTVPEFFGIYVRGLLLATTIVLAVFVASLASLPLRAMLSEATANAVLGVVIVLVTAFMAYALLGPYQQVRVFNLCMRHTDFPGVRLVSSMSARAFARLQLKNLMLTLLTLGLYRPFAVVSAYRYRLDHLHLEVEGGFDHVVSQAAARGGAAGDGAADFLGVDLSW